MTSEETLVLSAGNSPLVPPVRSSTRKVKKEVMEWSVSLQQAPQRHRNPRKTNLELVLPGTKVLPEVASPSLGHSEEGRKLQRIVRGTWTDLLLKMGI